MGAHAVMANGGVIAPVGLNMVALAAKRHAVPFAVLAGVYKVLCCRSLIYLYDLFFPLCGFSVTVSIFTMN